MKLSTSVINGYVVGEHGDGQVPIWSHVTVEGIPIDAYCSDVGIEWNDNIKKALTGKTKNMGSQIIAAKGCTHYGIATCVCQLTDAITNMKPTILSQTPYHPADSSIQSLYRSEYQRDLK